MDGRFLTFDFQIIASLVANRTSAMSMSKSGRGFSSAELFKRRVKWRDRAESAFQCDRGDLLAGGDQQAL
jgi:hypothetical protein